MPLELDDITTGYNLDKIQANFDKIETFLNTKVLKRIINIGEDNIMHTHLDMNQNKIVNDEGDITNAIIGVDPTDAVALQAALDALGG